MTRKAPQRRPAARTTPQKPIPLILAVLKTRGDENHRSIAETIGVSEMSVSRWLQDRCAPEPERVQALCELAHRKIPGMNNGPLFPTRLREWVEGAQDDELREHMLALLDVDNPLQRARIAARLNVKEAAEKLGISRQYLHGLEARPPNDPAVARYVRQAQTAWGRKAPRADRSQTPLTQ